MKPELEKKLVEKYPKLLSRKDMSVRDSCMAWGMQHNDGWYNLLYNLLGTIQGYIRCNRKPQVEIDTIKEKYGSLRIYAYNTDDIVDGMIWFAEHLSYHICEECGSMEDVAASEGWIAVKCAKCWKKYHRRMWLKGIKYKLMFWRG